MSKRERYIVGLDIGSTKTCALMGEMEEEAVRFVALGAAESKGMRKGQVVNLDATISSIRRAVEEAETASGVPIESALLGVAGGDIRGGDNHGGGGDANQNGRGQPSTPSKLLFFRCRLLL